MRRVYSTTRWCATPTGPTPTAGRRSSRKWADLAAFLSWSRMDSNQRTSRLRVGRSARAGRSLERQIDGSPEPLRPVHGVERLELLPGARPRGAPEVRVEGGARREAVDEEVALPAALVGLLEPAAPGPEETRLAEDVGHVLLLEPAEVALAAVRRDPRAHQVEDAGIHGARPYHGARPP